MPQRTPAGCATAHQAPAARAARAATHSGAARTGAALTMTAEAAPALAAWICHGAPSAGFAELACKHEAKHFHKTKLQLAVPRFGERGEIEKHALVS